MPWARPSSEIVSRRITTFPFVVSATHTSSDVMVGHAPSILYPRNTPVPVIFV
jgi:hypothetical protein